jgi:hypothetical protein
LTWPSKDAESKFQKNGRFEAHFSKKLN